MTWYLQTFADRDGCDLCLEPIFATFCASGWSLTMKQTQYFQRFYLLRHSIKCGQASPMFFFLIDIFLPFPSANWCQHWFEFFPNPPVNILGMVENILVHHDKRLMEHFVNCNVTSQVTYALFCFPVPTVCRLSWLFWLISSLPDVRLAIATDALIWSSNQRRVVESLG